MPSIVADIMIISFTIVMKSKKRIILKVKEKGKVGLVIDSLVKHLWSHVCVKQINKQQDTVDMESICVIPAILD